MNVGPVAPHFSLVAEYGGNECARTDRGGSEAAELRSACPGLRPGPTPLFAHASLDLDCAGHI